MPLALLGIRSAWKDDIKATTAEMMYGRALRLPGELLAVKPEQRIEPENYAAQLRKILQAIKPTQTSNHDVFLRVDTMKKAMQPPYEGPYEVIKWNDRTVTIKRDEQLTTVSTERIKPAFMDNAAEEPQRSADEQPQPNQPTQPTTTRSGRTIKKTVRFQQ